LPIEPLSNFDLNLMFADLTSQPGKEEAVQSKLAELIKLDAKRPEPYRLLGYMACRGGRTDEAVKQFAKAYELGDRDSGLLWDYGRLAERRSPPDAIKVLSELLDKQPDRMEVRLELPRPADAARFFRVTVYAYLPAVAGMRWISRTDGGRTGWCWL
jgi:hypothetical protein